MTRWSPNTRHRTLCLFVAVSVLWGVPYLFIAAALDSGLTPQAVVAGRVLTGAATLLVMTGVGPVRRLIAAAPLRVAAVAVTEVLVPFSLIAWAETSVDSSTTGVLIALEPLFVVVWSLVVVRHYRDVTRTTIGSVLGIVGVVLLLGAPSVGFGAVLIVGAAASYGLGAVLIGRWFVHVRALTLAAAILAVAAPPVVALASVSGHPGNIRVSGLASLAVLGVICTAGGFVAFFALIANAGAHSASLITYAAPVVALAAGVLLRGEPVTVTTLAATVLILLAAAVCLYKRDGVDHPHERASELGSEPGVDRGLRGTK